jgi:hypothetical protein
MVAFDEDTGEAMLTLTVVPPPPAQRAGADEVWIKAWSENEGVYEALVHAGVITPSNRIAGCGYAAAMLGVLTQAAIHARDLAWQEKPGLREIRAKVYPKEGAVG